MVKLERLGARIRELRYRRGLTQAQLAYKAGVGEKTLKRLEGGHTDTPRPETLGALAGALGVPPESLFEAAEIDANAAPPAIHQLPRPPQNFTGREAEVAQLQAHVEHTGARVASVHGMGGMGKTSLALVVAERVSERFPDGQIFLDLRGTSDPLRPSDAMLHVIRSLDPSRALPKSDAEVAAAYRSLLRSKRVLLVFDNAEGRQQVEPLLPPDGSFVLVTSRQRFAIQGEGSVALAPLAPAAARALIDTLAPHARQVGDTLAGLCSGLPLALSLAGRALAERPDLDPSEYAARLADDSSRLAQLDASEASGGVEASFALSFAMLEEDLRAGLCVLAVFPQHFDRSAAGALWQLDASASDRRIGTLVRFNLLEWDGAGTAARYRLHDLVRLFLDARLSADARHGANLRHAEHYLELLVDADSDLRSGHDPLATLATVDRDWLNVRAAVAFSSEHAASDRAAAKLCLRAADAATVLRLRMHAAERLGWYEAACSVAHALGDARTEGRLLAYLARAHQELGEPQRSRELAEAAIALAPQHSDHAAHAHALVTLGDAHHALGQPRAALDAAARGLALAREHHAQEEEALALVVLAWGNHVLGEPERGVQDAEAALPIARDLGDRTIEATALLALAFALRGSGLDARAREVGERCLQITRDLGDRRIEGYSLLALVQPLSASRETPSPQEQALEIARETGDRRMEGHALVMVGTALSAVRDQQHAIDALEEAVRIAEETGDQAMLGNALSILGVLYTLVRDLPAAVLRLQRAEQVSSAMGNRRQEARAAWLLGCALELQGEVDAAIAAMERAAEYQEQTAQPDLEHTRMRIARLRARR
jgi:transcriptional regulator with XRE-family HTH domain/tetratricopeptide (TPR) repeat protein